MAKTAPVTAAVVTKDPNMRHFRLTLASLLDQESPPAEVVIVDSTEEGPPFEVSPSGSGCGYCGGVDEMLGSLSERVERVEIVHDTDAGIGKARAIAASEASQPYYWELDEDSVILSSDWTQVAVERLEADDGVVGVGGNAVEALSGKPSGEVFSFLQTVSQFPPGGSGLMYPTNLCDGGECYTSHDRGEDIDIRVHLLRHGSLARDPRLALALDYPTTRQESLKNVLVGAGISAVVSTAVNVAYNRLSRGVA